MNSLIWIELSKSALRNNIEIFKNTLGKSVLFCCAVKSNAYGHGFIEISKLCEEYGADWLCVNSVAEGITLRTNNISLPILVMGFVEDQDLQKVVDYDLRIFLYDMGLAKRLTKGTKVHVKVDTGMHRQGVSSVEFESFMNDLSHLDGIKIEGVATHFATSDELGDTSLFWKQLRNFEGIKSKTYEVNNALVWHCANSAAALVYPESHMDMVRTGISLYGLYPSTEVHNFCSEKNIELQPVLSLKTKVVQVKKLSKGESVSYGATFTADKEIEIAVLPVGYYDGLDRGLSNKGSVLIGGKRASIVGRVCMNLTMVDISNIDDVHIGDEVVVIGKQGSEKIDVDEIAKLLGTINYEVVTRLRESIEKKVVD